MSSKFTTVIKCLLETGDHNMADPLEIMTSAIQFAQKAAVVHEGQLLMVRKSATDPFNPGKWELPGGRLKFGEAIDEHLCREVREEVGLDVAPGDPLHVWSWIMQSGRKAVQVVALARICQLKGGTLSIAGQDGSDHLDRAEWITLHDLAALDVIPSQQEVIATLTGRLFRGDR